MRSGVRTLCVILLLVSVAAPASGQKPLVRIKATPAGVQVGQPVKLTVTVLVPTWFPQPPVWPAFELTNTITRLPSDSSYPTNERFGRDTWSGIVREYQVYPLIGATYRLTGQTMQVTYTNPENYKPVTVEVDVPEVEFRALVPAGADTLNPYIAGRRLTLDRAIEGDVDSLEAGDALVVTYTAELDGMPAIFLPTLVHAPEVEGVSVYPEEPAVDDGPPARRSEKLTIVFEAGGDFNVPAAEIRWWNTRTSAVEVASVPAMTVSVTGPPVPDPVEEEPATKPVWPRVLAWAAILVVALWVLRRWAARVRSSWAAYQERRRASEEYAFNRLRTALRGGDPGPAHQALLAWLERIDPGTGARLFARRYGDEKLQLQTEALSRSLYSDGDSVNLRHLEKSLTSARRRRIRESTVSSSVALPPMNP